MTHPENPEELQEFIDRIDAIWQQYQVRGPGNLDKELWKGVTELQEVLLQSQTEPEFEQAVNQLASLAERCVLRPEGLNFVTGESGLLPRKEWHGAMKQGLNLLRQQVEPGND